MIPDLLRAICFAADRHCFQRRKGLNDVPYINHLLEVASLLSNVANVQNTSILIAAVLHDIIEDTATTSEEIEQKFGAEVQLLVEAVTDNKSISKEERKQLVLDHLANATSSVKLIKLADLCSNISSIPSNWTLERLTIYFDWVQQVAALCSGVSPALDELFRKRWKDANTALSVLSK